MKVSIFKNFAASGVDVELDYVISRIRSGEGLVQTIDKIRELAKERGEAANDLKKTLPGITFCGTFKKRESKSLVQSTGLAILDFDEVEDLPMTRQTLIEDPFIHCVFVSPRGNGLKALVKIPSVSSDQEFKQYFYSLQKRYPDADPSGKDIARFCFMSYDPEIHFNPTSDLWVEKVEQGTQGTIDIPAVQKVRTDYKKAGIAIKMIENATSGNRNNTILKAGRLMGGLISAGEVNELDILDFAQEAIHQKDPESFRENFNTFRKGIANGKMTPIQLDEQREIEQEVKIGKIDYTIEDSDSELDNMFNNGLVSGKSTGWKHLDKYYTIRLGFTTYIYGAPFTGKSKWWFNVLVNLSIQFDWKHLIYSPETGAAHDVYAMLIQIYAEGDVTNTFNNRMSKEKYLEAKTFIGKHFIVVSTDETDTDITPDELLDYVDVLEIKYKTKIHTVTIDPWNELKHESDDARDEVLNQELKRVRVKARKKDRHICLITHIRDQKALGYDVYGTAIYPFPTARDVAGGQVWYRKGFMMISFFRHFMADGIDEVQIGKDRFFK